MRVSSAHLRGQIQSGHIWLGTSGIVLPGNKSTFPEQFRGQTRLHYYSHLFNSLEINSSFYKIPKLSTFAKWANEVTPDFKFSVKLWRGITHAKRLNFLSDDVHKFMSAVAGLGNKCGCLLIQFPASIKSDLLERVNQLLIDIKMRDGQNAWRVAVEFRDRSWYQEQVYKMLASHHAILVLHDMPTSASLDLIGNLNSRDIYFRFHGPTGKYNGSYSKQFIDEYGEAINELKQEGKNTYIYFNNTVGSALQDAQYLWGLSQPR